MADFDRTEPASPRRRQEFRERGEVAKSRDLAGAVVLLGVLGALAGAGEGLAESLHAQMRSALASMAGARSRPVGEGLSDSLASVATALVPILGVAAAAALAGHLGQTGPLFSSKAIEPRWDRLSLLPRLRQIFSAHGLVELVKTVLKLATVGAVVYEIASREMVALSALAERPPAEIAASLCSLALRIAGYGGMALVALGALDLAYQRWHLERKMRMTKAEARDELKRQEGDPLTKMRLRARQRELARQRMMEAVKSADAVITNPTHVAVALAYRPREMAAPRVVAKGRGVLAERIREVARAHGIPLFENRPLARALYRAVKVGREVPVALYRAVAEVLAYVYTRRGRGPDGRPVGGGA
jgi:flagellar biosynthetic protein FlhB